MIFHPTRRQLNRFADGLLTGRRRRRVAAHLARCSPCRTTVGETQRLSEAARALPAPPVPPGVYRRAVERRDAGERFILPVADPPRRRTGRHRVAAGFATSVLLVAFALGAVHVARLRADRSELLFVPSAPAPGATIHVTYQPSGMFAGAHRLLLRARFGPSAGLWHDPPVVVADTLVRGSGGSLHGVFRLPDSVPYAVFAVEDTAGERIDSNARRLWEVMAHDADGNPTVGALAAKALDLEARNWDLAYAAAHLAADIHPKSPGAWMRLGGFELDRGRALGQASGLPAPERQSYAELNDRLRRSRHVPGDDLGAMMLYAGMAGDTAGLAYWSKRLLSEAPSNVRAVQLRALYFYGDHEADPAAIVREFDRLWSRYGTLHPQIVLMGYRAAVASGRAPAIRRWWERLAAIAPAQAANFALALARDSSTRAVGVTLLRAALARAPAQYAARRPLAATVAQEARVVEAARSRLLAGLGEALVAAGARRAGLDTLAIAAEGGWFPDAAGVLARVRLQLGDTVAALPAIARLVVDPSTGPDSAAALAALGSRLGEGRWAQLVSAARDRMRLATLRDATVRLIHTPMRLDGLNGGRTTLDALARDRITVVALWSRYGDAAEPRLERLDQMATWLAARGAQLIVLTTEQPDAGLRKYIARARWHRQLYSVSRAGALRSLQAWGTPELFVLDGAGRIRFDHTAEADVRRQVAVLRSLGEPVASTQNATR